MINVNHNVTLLKASREEWRRIESEEATFTLREYRSPYETVAFIFIDATTGEHLGNAFIISVLTFGGLEHTPWSWSMFAKLTGLTEQELKKRFPIEAKAKDLSQYEMHLYEIRPTSDNELLQRLCDE